MIAPGPLPIGTAPQEASQLSSVSNATTAICQTPTPEKKALKDEQEMEPETSMAAIGQELNVLGKNVVADLKMSNMEEPLVVGHQANQA